MTLAETQFPQRDWLDEVSWDVGLVFFAVFEQLGLLGMGKNIFN